MLSIEKSWTDLKVATTYSDGEEDNRLEDNSNGEGKMAVNLVTCHDIRQTLHCRRCEIMRLKSRLNHFQHAFPLYHLFARRFRSR